MPYDVYTRNKRTLDNIYKRKLFKKHIFILDNTEGYFWDDYDISHIYREKTPQTTSSTQTPNHSSTSSTQTTPVKKENKFSLFQCLLFIVLISLSRISSL